MRYQVESKNGRRIGSTVYFWLLDDKVFSLSFLEASELCYRFKFRAVAVSGLIGVVDCVCLCQT